LQHHLVIQGLVLKLVIIPITLFLSLSAGAGDRTNISEKSKIESILQSIPSKDKSMPYKNIAERLPNLGLSVHRVTIDVLKNENIDTSNGMYRKGDIVYDFSTNEPNDVVKAICPILSQFSFIKRGKSWLPEYRTANFIMNGYETCKPPKVLYK
jgi:hypothetical protein